MAEDDVGSGQSCGDRGELHNKMAQGSVAFIAGTAFETAGLVLQATLNDGHAQGHGLARIEPNSKVLTIPKVVCTAFPAAVALAAGDSQPEQRYLEAFGLATRVVWVENYAPPALPAVLALLRGSLPPLRSSGLQYLRSRFRDGSVREQYGACFVVSALGVEAGLALAPELFRASAVAAPTVAIQAEYALAALGQPLAPELRSRLGGATSFL